MKKYFGILENKNLNLLAEEDQLKFMIENELFYLSNSYSIGLTTTEIKINEENQTIELKPTQVVINSFYSFLKEELSRDINQQFLSFFNDYNDRVYGLSNKQQRKIALKHFNKLFKKIKVLNASFVKTVKDDNGIEKVKNMNRFDFLKGRQNGQKKQLATTENILEFLNGKKDYFKNEQFINKPSTKQFIEFEANLKILISLNGQYKFEEDFHFTDLAKLKNQFANFGDTFKSFDIFIFTHKKIQSFTKSKMAYITSLYDALFEMNLVSNNKANFLNYLNLEHQLELTKLKYFEPEENKQHDQRVLQFKLELQEYISKKINSLTEEVENPNVNTSKKKNLKIFTDKDALDYLFKNTFNCK